MVFLARENPTNSLPSPSPVHILKMMLGILHDMTAGWISDFLVSRWWVRRAVSFMLVFPPPRPAFTCSGTDQLLPLLLAFVRRVACAHDLTLYTGLLGDFYLFA